VGVTEGVTKVEAKIDDDDLFGDEERNRKEFSRQRGQKLGEVIKKPVVELRNNEASALL